MVCGPALSCHLSLPLSFLHPIPFHFSHYATQPKLPSTVPVLLLAKDSQKLLGLHTMIQAILLFSHPSSNCCPSFAGDLFAGHGDGLGEQRAHSSSGVHGACLKSHCYVPFSRESLACDWAVTAMEHGDIYMPGSSRRTLIHTITLTCQYLEYQSILGHIAVNARMILQLLVSDLVLI